MADLIKLPSVAADTSGGNLHQWLKQEGDTIQPGDILAEIESTIIAEALRRCEGNVGVAATQLQIGKTALYDKMKQRGLSPKLLRKMD